MISCLDKWTFKNLIEPQIYKNELINKYNNINGIDRHDCLAIMGLLQRRMQHKT